MTELIAKFGLATVAVHASINVGPSNHTPIDLSMKCFFSMSSVAILVATISEPKAEVVTFF